MQTNIINLSDEILQHAIHRHASDIHIENFEDNIRIRLRIDGLLHSYQQLPINLADAINSRFKIMAKLDITERRLPQDGRFEFQYQQQRFDCRFSSCPTLHGEKIVIRLLNTENKLLHISELGLLPQQLTTLHQVLSQPQGLILITGPTGSGKTQTLYALLNELNQEHRNIISIEDPIEIQLNQINQINVKHKIGLNFATLLRAILRQDPDIIMVGEIRDLETAEMVIRSAHTGHLVLATLHTRSANEAVNRLMNIGIHKHDIDATLKLVINQRLVRKLCQHCNHKENNPSGCEHCSKGYHSRIGIFELSHSSDSQPISLWEAAQQKLANGITDKNEIYRTIEQP
ncbi:MAG: GspE/PulE family protein [Gammaproteobacteria bacterium]|nr:GspE/PulE family protein [Gammaproteobacteria bacterium]